MQRDIARHNKKPATDEDLLENEEISPVQYRQRKMKPKPCSRTGNSMYTCYVPGPRKHYMERGVGLYASLNSRIEEQNDSLETREEFALSMDHA